MLSRYVFDASDEIVDNLQSILGRYYTAGVDKINSYGLAPSGAIQGEFTAGRQKFYYSIDADGGNVSYRPVLANKTDSYVPAHVEYQDTKRRFDSFGLEVNDKNEKVIDGYLDQVWKADARKAKVGQQTAANKAGKVMTCTEGKTYACGARCFSLSKPCKQKMAAEVKQMAKQVKVAIDEQIKKNPQKKRGTVPELDDELKKTSSKIAPSLETRKTKSRKSIEVDLDEPTPIKKNDPNVPSLDDETQSSSKRSKRNQPKISTAEYHHVWFDPRTKTKIDNKYKVEEIETNALTQDDWTIPKKKPVKKYDDFKVALAQDLSEIGRDYSADDQVPIAVVRERMKERGVSDKKFNEWTNQANLDDFVGMVRSSRPVTFQKTNLPSEKGILSEMGDEPFVYFAVLDHQKNEIDKILKKNPIPESISGTTYDQFKPAIEKVYDGVTEQGGSDLVPVYVLRRMMGDRVTRKEFSDFLVKMQSEGKFQLQGGSVEDSEKDKIEDSVSTELNGLRTYARKLK